MESHATLCVARGCELLAETLRVDDHQLPLEDFIRTGELALVCAQMATTCLFLSINGRLGLPLGGQEAGTMSHQVEQSWWQKVGTTFQSHR